jgi:nitroreductase
MRAAARRGGEGAVLYYLLRRRVFRDEQRAVLAGRVHHEDSSRPDGTLHLLRRNTHRLEKGLVMQPRRSVFAAAYVGETVEAYRRLKDAESDCHEDLRWAHDVLARYFDAVDAASDARVADAAQRFERLEDLPGAVRAPFVRGVPPEGTASYQDVLALASHRRSVRWFERRPVPRPLLEQAFAVAATAPSACNRQSLRFLVFDDPTRVSSVLSVPMGTAGWGHQVPCAVVVVGQLRGYPAERDRHVVYVDGSLAVMSFILAAESLGLGTCCVNWAALPALERQLREQVHLDDDEVVVMMLAVGYPDQSAHVPYSSKRALSHLLEYNRR